MRLGNFWGMTVPMSLLIFDGQYDRLINYLSILNTDMSKHLLVDVQKEIMALLNVIGCASYKLPEYEQVIDSLVETGASVQNGVVDGDEEGILFQQIVTELSYKVLEVILKRAHKGEFYQVPAKLRDYVEDFCRKTTFDGLSVSGLPGKIVKTLDRGKSLNLGENVKTFQLEKAPPKSIYFGSKKTELSPELQQVWKFYADREDVLRKMLRCCVTGYQEEETVFGVPFFSFIKRKPESIRYMVLDIFARARSVQTERFLPDCIKECSEEINKFVRLVAKFVTQEGTEVEDIEMMDDTKLTMHSHEFFKSEEEADVFAKYVLEGKLVLTDMKRTNFELIIELYRILRDFEKKSIAELLGVEGISDEDLCKKCCDIGICGLNQYSLRLFEEAMEGITLSGKGKIQKSEEDWKKLTTIVADVFELIRTLVPVGGGVG